MNLKLFDYAMEPVIYIGEFIVKSFQARTKKADYYKFQLYTQFLPFWNNL